MTGQASHLKLPAGAWAINGSGQFNGEDAMAKRPSKRRDVNQIAADIVSAVERGEVPQTPDGKNPLAVALGRRGGLKGGPARAAKLTPKQLSETARKAAQARWGQRGK